MISPRSSIRTEARLRVEALEDRCTPAVTAVFNGGILTVLGDNAANVIRVGADSGGNLVVTNNNQTVAIQVVNGNATRDGVQHIVIDGKGGNDALSTDASLNRIVNGSLAGAADVTMLGGAGNDTLQVGHGGIVGGLAGVDANGVVVGPVVGNAFMDGGTGDDTLISGFGNDTMLGGTGDDNYLWPPGTLTDFWDGGAGFDTVTIVGNDTFLSPDPAGDVFQLTANGQNVRFQRTNLVQFTVDIARTESIVLRPGAGDDTVNIGDLTGVTHLKTVIVQGADGNDTLDGSAQRNRHVSVILDGGAGNDTLRGGAGRDLLLGSAGDDTLDGGDDHERDVLIGGEGTDSFVKRKKDLLVDLVPGEDH